MKIMKLMTDELRGKLPKLYATEHTPMLEKVVQASYFLPGSFWYWYPVEFDGNDTFWGVVAGDFVEFGYFQLSELQSIRGPWGLPMERDVYWDPTFIVEVVRRHKERPGAGIILGDAA